MKRQFKLIIPCYFENEGTIINDTLGKESDISNYDIHDVTIYQLPFALSPYIEKGKHVGSRVNVGNDYFISSLKVNELEILIESELEQ